MKTKLLNILFFLLCINFYGQNTVIINGKVRSSQGNSPVAIATVSVAGSPAIAVVDEEGNFTLEIEKAPPVEIHINAIGFKHYKRKVQSSSYKLIVYLDEDVTSLDQVVLSASRTPERVFESPVSIERVGPKAIETTTSASFYDGLENLKGVDVNTSSLTFKSVNTRGFATFANTRFVQLVDGLDNSSPGLNFALGNLVGLNELDVQSVELLPGASSALYGANAFNGIMLMRSKSPFTNPGISVYGKTGFTSSNNAGTNHFIDAGFRIAKKFNDKVALKMTGSLFRATDWNANDSRNINEQGRIIDGNRDDTPFYDGINSYGDEVGNTFDGIGKVTRTGYDEADLVDYGADSFKTDLTLHIRPIKGDNDTELIVGSKLGTGNAIYQGASRYALRNFIMHQHKIELRSKNFMFRSYASLENAGNSYDIRFAGININNAWKDNTTWFTEYARAFAGVIPNVIGGSDTAARKFAQRDRLIPGTRAFNEAFNKVIKNPDLTSGAKFVDRSQLYHSDLNYNFKDQIEFAEIQIGGSARRYVLNSEGTIYTDQDRTISYDEFGIYTQIQKKLADDRLKLTGSIRYDKAQNFEGNLSPRFSVSFSPDQKKNHNIRASFQTGFRNPTTQEQYIGLNLGNTLLIGAASENPARYTKDFNVSSAVGQAIIGGTSVGFSGSQAYSNSFTRSSLEAFGAASKKIPNRVAEIIADSGNTISQQQAAGQATIEVASLLEKSNINMIKPEQVRSYELGYRGKLAKHTILDASAYYNQYKDFVSIVTVIAPLYGNVSAINPANIATDQNTQLLLNAIVNNEYTPVSLYANTNADVVSYGLNIGIETTIGDGYDVGINYAFAKQDFNQEDDPDFETGFNTPQHKVKASFGNNDVYNGLGFGLNVRWQDTYYWQSSFVDETIDARTLVDAQVMYNIRKWNSKIKVGGANILGHNYFVAPGTGMIGSQFYGSWIYNF